jgi:catechol 2,3-dioxygenase-like lactoylglutathione lyase family enzyme
MFLLSHFCVIVSDLDASIAFYRDIMGMQIRSKGTHTTVIAKAIAYPGAEMNSANLFFAGEPRPWLELIQYVKPKGKKAQYEIQDIGSSHFCFNVDDIDAAYAELKKKGVHFLSEPVRIPPNPQTGSKGGAIVYFRDPDGFSLELYQANT